MNLPNIFKMREFYVLLVGLIMFVVRAYLPGFPFSNEQILEALIWVLGLFGIVVSFRLRQAANELKQLKAQLRSRGLIGHE